MEQDLEVSGHHFEIQHCCVLEKHLYEFTCPSCDTLLKIEKILADESEFFAEVFECECGTKIKIIPTE